MNYYDEQIKDAQARRADAYGRTPFQGPQGRMAGRIYTAAHPLEYLSAALRSAGAARDASMAGQEIKDLQGTRSESNKKALAEFLRQSQGTPEEVLPEGQAGPVRPAQAPDMRSAYSALMESPDYAQMGQQGLIQMPQIEAQALAKEEDRVFRAQEAQLTREARAQELQMRMQDQRASQQERLEAQREMRQMQIDAAIENRKIIASNRLAPQAQIIQTDAGILERKGNEWVPITVGGKPVVAKPKSTAGLSATAQKELFEADDLEQVGLGAMDSLKKAMELSKIAYSGVGASTRAKIRSELPFNSAEADATVNMDNIIKDQALGSMRAIFGGNPTEGERSVLLDLQASSGKTPNQRAAILDRAYKAADRRVKFNQQKAAALRSGKYMTEGASPTLTTVTPTADAIAAELARRRGAK